MAKALRHGFGIGVLFALTVACGTKESERPGRYIRSTPRNNAEGVSTTAGISVTFSDPVDLPADFQLTSEGDECVMANKQSPLELSSDNFVSCIPATTCLLDDYTVAIQPEELQENLKYYIKIAGLNFIGGAKPLEETVITFSTASKSSTQEKSGGQKICDKN